MLQAGSIVTVILEGSSFKGWQGIIQAIIPDGHPDGSIAVHFPATYRHLFGISYKKSGTIRFVEEDLRQDEDWTLENRVAVRWPGDMRPWRTAIYNHPLDLTQLCDREGCPHLATTRIMINIWGTGCDADVCDEHKGVDGWCVEEFPFRKREKALEPQSAGA